VKSNIKSQYLAVVAANVYCKASIIVTPFDLICICRISLLAQDKVPHILTTKESPTLKVFDGTTKEPTPFPIIDASPLA